MKRPVKLPKNSVTRPPAFVRVDTDGRPRPRAWEVLDVEIDLRSGMWTETARFQIPGGGILYRVLTDAGPAIVYVESAP
jgi:hypothetical protein